MFRFVNKMSEKQRERFTNIIDIQRQKNCHKIMKLRKFRMGGKKTQLQKATLF